MTMANRFPLVQDGKYARPTQYPIVPPSRGQTAQRPLGSHAARLPPEADHTVDRRSCVSSSQFYWYEATRDVISCYGLSHEHGLPSKIVEMKQRKGAKEFFNVLVR